MQTLYTATVTASGGREGTVKSANGKFEQKLVMPKELGGSGTEGTNPEELFAAGYAGCFQGALRLVAKNSKVALKGDTVTANVSIGSLPSGGFGLAVTLSVTIPGLERDVAEKLMNQAHMVCPYSIATRNNIAVTLDLK